MNMSTSPNLGMLHDLTFLNAQDNNFINLGNFSKFMSHTKLTDLVLRRNNLQFLCNFTKFVERSSSSRLFIHVDGNKLDCNRDLC